MRTAEEILKYDMGLLKNDTLNFETAVIAINKGMKIAIEESARVATTKVFKPNGIRALRAIGVDKKAILSLIKELK